MHTKGQQVSKKYLAKASKKYNEACSSAHVRMATKKEKKDKYY